MPELPEVEIVRQSLDKKIKQKKVKKIIVRNRNLRIKIPLNFTSMMENQKIIKVDRFSKFIILHLSKVEKLQFSTLLIVSSCTFSDFQKSSPFL